MKPMGISLTVADARQRKLFAPAVEIAFVLLCVLAAEWAIIPLFGRRTLLGAIPAVAAFAIMVLSHRLRRESPRELGFRLDNFAKSLLLLLPAMAAAAVFLICIGWFIGSLRLSAAQIGWNAVRVFASLFVWGLVQQYALQAFINRRAQNIWGTGIVSIVFTASLFAILHLPNLWLSVATFFGGLLWAWAYQRTPNLFALALSHAAMTIMLVGTVPPNSLHGMRVGYGYFLFQP
jgi:membrane protease YdiL (CAAX protease family)